MMLNRQFSATDLNADWSAFRNIGLYFIARLLLCSPFVASGFSKLLDFNAATAEMRELFGLEPAGVLAALTIILQLGGSMLLSAGGRLAVVGALTLSGFTLAATLLAHAFWMRSGQALVAEANTFFEHVGLIVGLLLAGFVPPIRGEA